MKKLIALITVIFFISSAAFAQLGEIKGFVKDKKTGEPLFGANVYIETAGVKMGDASDPDGKFTINPVKSGLHTVYVTVLGYKPIEMKNVSVTSDKITYINFEMGPGAIDITAFEKIEYREPLISKDEPGIQHIPIKQFKRNVNRMNPIMAITTMTAGLTLAPNGKDVYVRGARPQSTQFITDGMKSITGGIGIPGLAIGSVKVYTGGVPARYGDLTGGVIVVETTSYFDLAQKYK